MVQMRRKTDYGTVILHAALVLIFITLLTTGLRIAADDPIAMWLQFLDPVLPTQHLWYRHMVAGVLLLAVLVAYVVYLTRARLTARINLDKARMIAMLQPGRGRLPALNVLVYWIMMGSLLVEVVTGVMLFAQAGRMILSIHLYATFVCLAAIASHVALHAAHGGIGQLLRIIRPAPLHIPAKPPDLAELLAEQLAQRNAAPLPPSSSDDLTSPDIETSTGTTVHQAACGHPVLSLHTSRQTIERSPEPQRRSMRLQANPLVTALIAAAAVTSIAVGSEKLTRPTLRVLEIKSSEIPLLDGDLSDPVWRKAKMVSVLTTQGGDFGGSGQSLSKFARCTMANMPISPSSGKTQPARSSISH